MVPISSQWFSYMNVNVHATSNYCILWCILSRSIGTSKPGASLELERGVRESEGAGACMTFNPNINLSITQQRQRLPIFQVQCIILCTCAASQKRIFPSVQNYCYICSARNIIKNLAPVGITTIKFCATKILANLNFII